MTSNVDTKDYDSTASTPKVERKHVAKKISTIGKKSTKCKFNINLDTSSAPPKLRLKAYETGKSAENEYKRIKKNIFCHPEEHDDNDFYLNYHPSSIIGYECFDFGFVVPEVNINYCFFKI
jgi:hypothetical protein